MRNAKMNERGKDRRGKPRARKGALARDSVAGRRRVTVASLPAPLRFAPRSAALRPPLRCASPPAPLRFAPRSAALRPALRATRQRPAQATALRSGCDALRSCGELPHGMARLTGNTPCEERDGIEIGCSPIYSLPCANAVCQSPNVYLDGTLLTVDSSPGNGVPQPWTLNSFVVAGTGSDTLTFASNNLGGSIIRQRNHQCFGGRSDVLVCAERIQDEAGNVGSRNRRGNRARADPCGVAAGTAVCVVLTAGVCTTLTTFYPVGTCLISQT